MLILASKISAGSSTFETSSPAMFLTGTFITYLLWLARLDGRFNDDYSALRARHRTPDGQQISFGIHDHHFKVLCGNALHAHVPGAARTLLDTAWRRARTACA